MYKKIKRKLWREIYSLDEGIFCRCCGCCICCCVLRFGNESSPFILYMNDYMNTNLDGISGDSPMDCAAGILG